MADMNGLFLSTKLLEMNPKLNVIIMSDHIADLECNYKFNILKKRVSIFKLLSVVNESISNLSYMITNSIYDIKNSYKAIAF
jgi:hypothetical protein